MNRHGILPENPGHAAYPLGAVRLRKSGRSQVRMIKVTHHGPKPKRWMELARHWWLKHKGAIPQGLRVAHADGNTLNDDPGNYQLMTGGQIVQLYLRTSKAAMKRMRERGSKATAQCNRQRAQVERQLRILEDRWYPVDVARKLIINEPRRERWQVYRDQGLEVHRRNGRGFIPAALSWPELLTGPALVMASMSQGAATARAIQAAVRDLAARHGHRSAYHMTSIHNFTMQLRHSGLITVQRRGRHEGLYALAVPAREPSPIAAVKGRDLQQDRYTGFSRDGMPMPRRSQPIPPSEVADAEMAEDEEYLRD